MSAVSNPVFLTDLEKNRSGIDVTCGEEGLNCDAFQAELISYVITDTAASTSSCLCNLGASATIVLGAGSQSHDPEGGCLMRPRPPLRQGRGPKL